MYVVYGKISLCIPETLSFTCRTRGTMGRYDMMMDSHLRSKELEAILVDVSMMSAKASESTCARSSLCSRVLSFLTDRKFLCSK